MPRYSRMMVQPQPQPQTQFTKLKSSSFSSSSSSSLSSTENNNNNNNSSSVGKNPNPLSDIALSLLESLADPFLVIHESGRIEMANNAASELFFGRRNRNSTSSLIGRHIDTILLGGGGQTKDYWNYILWMLGPENVPSIKRTAEAIRMDGNRIPVELGLSKGAAIPKKMKKKKTTKKITSSTKKTTMTKMMTSSPKKRMNTEECSVEGEEEDNCSIEDSDEMVYCCLIRDISSQKEYQRKLQQEQSFYEGVIDASFDALIVTDDHGRIHSVNEASTHKFGWSREQFLGQNIKMVIQDPNNNNNNNNNNSNNNNNKLKKIEETPEQHHQHHQQKQPMTTLVRANSTNTYNNTNKTANSGALLFESMGLTKKKLYDRASLESLTNEFTTNSNNKNNNKNDDDACFFTKRPKQQQQHQPLLLEEEEQHQQQQSNTDYYQQRELIANRYDGSTFEIRASYSEIQFCGPQRLYAIFIRDLSDEKKMIHLEVEKAATDALLFNMLPEEIALRLRDDPSHIAEHHDNATILFADIVGFTEFSSTEEPKDVVLMLNELFSMFDDLVEKYDINKVKTIGDCYMVTSIPAIGRDSLHECTRICHFALDMMDAVQTYNERQLNHQHQQHSLTLRIGMNVGPVVAGVVGTKRFQYDLWGDSVNIASRMESTGLPTKIQVTKAVVDLVGDKFEFQSRGMVPIKGKGHMDTYLLEGRKVRRPTRNSLVRKRSSRKHHHHQQHQYHHHQRQQQQQQQKKKLMMQMKTPSTSSLMTDYLKVCGTATSFWKSQLEDLRSEVYSKNKKQQI